MLGVLFVLIATANGARVKLYEKQLNNKKNETGAEEASSDGPFEKTLQEARKEAFATQRIPIYKAACDLNAFTCKQVVEFVRMESLSKVETLKAFTEARNGAGCISDPQNKQEIVNFFANDFFTKKDAPEVKSLLENLKEAGENVIPPPIVLPQTGIRNEAEMAALVGKIEAVLLNQDDKLDVINEEIKTHKEQFTGPQLVQLMGLFSFDSTKAAVATTLEQYITGVTCEQVVAAIKDVLQPTDKYEIIRAMKANIIDGQYKSAIVAANTFNKAEVEELLRDVGAGIPPKNNPVFGVIKGNPVVFVIDESGSMDTKFKLNGKTYTRREFCHDELENVLKGLPQVAGSKFNVIAYTASVGKAFPDVVSVSDENIAEAMQYVKHFGSGTTNSYGALDEAYKMKTSPEQIYFLTDGQPNGGTKHILEQIPAWDEGRNIPVNSIAFIMPGGDSKAKQFMKDMAEKTGGFFRAVEEDPNGQNDQSR
jgi:hypothetical protein